MTPSKFTAPSPLIAGRLNDAFANGLTYPQFLARAQPWRDELIANDAAAVLPDEEREALMELQPPLTVLAIVEEGCPDVVAALPILGRIERETGTVQVRVVLSSAYVDISNAYPHPDGRSRIPTFLFFDRDGHLRGIFIERPPHMDEFVISTFRRLVKEVAGPNSSTDPRQLSPHHLSTVTAQLLEARRAMRSIERQALVETIRQAAIRATPDISTFTS